MAQLCETRGKPWSIYLPAYLGALARHIKPGGWVYERSKRFRQPPDCPV